MLTKLRKIGEGYWQASGDTERLFSSDPGCSQLELWRTKWSRGGRCSPSPALSDMSHPLHGLQHVDR